MPELRSIHAGLGPIGVQIARATVDSGVARPVGAVDLAPELAGKSLGEVIERSELDDVEILDDLEDAIGGLKGSDGADVLVLATGSRAAEIAPQIFIAIANGLNVVSTAEELTWPWLRHPALGDEFARAAERHGVTVVGSGINPGFLLDLLPLVLCRPCLEVRKVVARRIVNVSLRRPQLQEKVGSGLTIADYESLAEQGRVGHVGLAESAALLAAGLGWEPDFLDESIEPVIAEQPTGSEYVKIEPGQVMGSHQTATATATDGRSVELVCRMTHGEPEPCDEVIVDGDPPVHMRIEGGIFGDTATAGCVVNILRQTVMAKPGMLTVKDLPVA